MSAAGLGEDDRLLLGAQFHGFLHGDGERLQQRFALGVVIDRSGETDEVVEIGDLSLDGGAVSFGKRRNSFVVVSPFLCGFVQRLVVLVEFLFQRFFRVLFTQLRLKSCRDRRERARYGEA